jgi:hypothetical protein
MSAIWGRDDRRVQAVYVVDAGTPLSILVETAGGRVALAVGKDRRLVLRLSPTGALRVVRLLQAAAP